MRIALSCDLLRFGGIAGDAEVNSAWLWPLLRPLLAEGADEITLHSRHDPATAAALAGLSPDTAWPRLYSDPGLVDAVRSTCGPLLDSDLVVGHELSPNQLRVLHAAGIPVLDLSIDAARFGDDLFLRARSTDPALSRLLRDAHVPDDALAAQAAALSTRRGPQPLPIAAGVLFAGQTDADASLIEDARLCSVLPFVDRIRAMLEPGWRLLLKPHPYARSNADILALHAAVPGSLVVSDNIYALLGAPGIHRVVTLSSSVAVEARLFGKRATTLVKPDRDTASPPTMTEARVTMGVLGNILRQRCGGRSRPVQGSLRPAVKQAWGYTPSPQLTGRTAAAGQVLTFGKSGTGVGLCTMGWSVPERDGCWSDGPYALLLLQPLAPGLSLTLDLAPFRPRGGPPVTLTVRGGAGPAVEATFTTPGTRRVAVNLPRASGPVELRLELGGVSSPAFHGLSEDGRVLGVKLLRARLAVPTANPAGTRRVLARCVHAVPHLAVTLLNLGWPGA